MAQFAAAVSVVTTDGPHGRCGVTCTAVCSVTDDPATILVCLNRRSRTNPVFRANGVLCVNLLGAGQEDVSAVFAGQSGIDTADRFVQGRWDTLVTGAPVFRDGIGALDCSIVEIKECGTHTIMFGHVTAVRSGSLRDSLVYFNRQYHALPVAPESFRLASLAFAGAT
jgi:flavin reductase